jgi:Xaa-Pro aminopeptidase
MFMGVEVETTHKFGEKPWLGFEHVTMVPMCRKLIDPSLFDPEEREWLNSYHKEVWEKTSGFFEGDERTTNWLKRETQQI